MDARPIVEERQACGYSRLHRRETIEVYFKGRTAGGRVYEIVRGMGVQSKGLLRVEIGKDLFHKIEPYRSKQGANSNI